MTQEQIKQARRTLGLTQTQLAAVMGLRGHPTIAEWENGKRSPDGRSIRLIQAYLEGYRPNDWPLSIIEE